MASSTTTKTGAVRRGVSTRLTPEDIDNFFRPAKKSKRAARAFLRRIGVEIHPDNTVTVHPL